jgi:DNA-binding NtrC family response regulator
MSGKEVLAHLHRDYPDVPVLMITGHGSPADVPGEEPEGVLECLAKPIEIEELVAKMKEAVSGK